MKKKPEYNITLVSKDPLIQQGIDIGDFNIKKELPKIADEITTVPIYVLWADGKIEMNEFGGTDVIAYLWREGDIIKGWSR